MQTVSKVAPATTNPKSQSTAAAKPASKPTPKSADPSRPAALPPTPATPQPAPATASKAPVAAPITAPSGPATAPQPIVPAPAPAWSNEDESAFQAMLARRKAAGYQRRGKDVGSQMLRPGEITPNAGTVVSTIVGLVAAAGTVGRGDLLDAMAKTAFPHPKARPADRAWCQGYVAGALRDGFLAVAGEGSPANNSKGTEQ